MSSHRPVLPRDNIHRCRQVSFTPLCRSRHLSPGMLRACRPQDGGESLLCGADRGSINTRSVSRTLQFPQGLMWQMFSGYRAKFRSSPSCLFCRMVLDCGGLRGASQQHVLSLQRPDTPPHFSTFAAKKNYISHETLGMW